MALSVRLTEEPWTVGRAHLEAVHAAGISDEGVVQAVTIVGAFNHLTRVADATGVPADYDSSLPRLEVDLAKDAPTGPGEARARWSHAEGPWSLDRRPQTQRALAAWAAYARAPSEALDACDRAAIGAHVASLLGDADGARAWGPARGSEREAALVRYAHKLTLTPWRMAEGDLSPLRRMGMDDRGLLDAIALVGFQNMDSRVRLALRS